MRNPTAQLPRALFRAGQVRAMDRAAINTHRIPGYELMTRAAQSVFTTIRVNWPEARSLCVVCGGGNNAGDGYVLARLAAQAGYQVGVVALVEAQALAGDAAQAVGDALDAGVSIRSWPAVITGEVIVDALLGTGLDRAVTGAWRDCIEAVNAAGVPVIGVDIPSGINADTGARMGAAVVCDLTVSFIALKPGLFTGHGRACAGTVLYDSLDVPAAVIVGETASACLASAPVLPRRAADAHKGQCGRVLVIGGNRGLHGAVLMAASAALRCGAGLVSAVVREPTPAPGLPELMLHHGADEATLARLIEAADVVLAGPGLGQDDWAVAMLDAVLASGKPRLLDADALRLLGTDAACATQILTPHPGEASALLGSTIDVIEADRFAALAALSERYGGSVILKGAGSLCGSRDSVPVVCDAGNPGMATAGAGDVLAGICAALYAGGMSTHAAAVAGMQLHALAGDVAYRRAGIGLTATDIIAALPAVLPR